MYEFSPENLRNPARNRRAGLMRQFSSGQLYSTGLHYVLYPCFSARVMVGLASPPLEAGAWLAVGDHSVY
jgi:hypothetical protein